VRHTAVFSFRSPVAREIFLSLSPEMEEIGPRSEVRVSLEGEDCLVLSVTAMDIPSLRAALNMWLRLISVAGEMLGITGPAGSRDLPGGKGDPLDGITGPAGRPASRGGGAVPGGRGPSGESRDLPGGKGDPLDGIPPATANPPG
jgi:KEOPS complex subunit Pcc1